MMSFLKRLFAESDAKPATAAAAAPPVIAARAPSTSTLPAALMEPDGDNIQVPLSEIVSRLSGPLAPRPSASLAGTFRLPVKTAAAQLPSGAVRIRFAQLRQAAAPGTFSDDPNLDEALVDLPLNRILPAINPGLLYRRSNQTQVDIPADINGLFDGQGKSSAHISRSKPMVAPIFAPPSIPAPAPVAQVPVAAPAPKVVQPVSEVRPPEPPPALVAKVPTGPALTVKLSSVYEFWPDSVRQEIMRCRWNAASVSLPMDMLESAMKTGRINFTWGELIQWLDVPAATPSPVGNTILDLPLKVLAPLFLSKRTGSTTQVQRKVVVSDSVPNLFSRPGKTPSQSGAAPALNPVAAPGEPNILGEIFGQPTKREWTPQEITVQVNAMAGVLASLIAMGDGFLVTGALPAPFKSETMAAFLPQIFGRLAHYATEIQLGQPSALTLVAGKSQCAIYKAGTIYLAVIGKPGETLPDAKLQRVAIELAERIQ